MRRALYFLTAALSAAAQHQVEDGHISKLSGGHEFASAVAWSRDGFLLIADGPGGKILRVDDKGKSVFRDSVAAAGLAFDDEGRLYACDPRLRQVIRIDKKNKSDVIASAWEGKRLNGPSDVVVLKKEHVYFTDPAFASADAEKQLPQYGIYHVGPKGDIASIAMLRARPNGIALSPDGRTLYASVADDRSVLAWTLDKNGTASDQRVFLRDIDGVPDGLDVGPDGRVFLAARQLLIYSPEGKLLISQPVAEKPVDVALGEADLNTVFVAAGGSVYRYRLPPDQQYKTGARH